MNYSDVPLQFQIQVPDSEKQPIHWHETLEIILVLNGTTLVTEENQQYSLKTNDIMVINAFQMHQIAIIDGLALVYQLDFKKLGPDLSFPDHRYFICNSSIDNQKELYKAIILQLANIANIMLLNTSNPYIHIIYQSRLYSFLYELYTHFSNADNTLVTPNKSPSFQRFREILSYIEERYTQKITLRELSEKYYVTQPYISNIFRQYLGKSYTEYIVNLRLNKACNMLSTTSLSIEEIAMKTGFANARSLSTYIKKEYGEIPSRYRKQYHIKVETSYIQEVAKEELKSPVLLAKALLENYSVDSDSTLLLNQKMEQQIQLPLIDTCKQDNNLALYFQHMISVYHYQHLLYKHVQEMCVQISESFRHSYFLLHHIVGNDSSCVFQVDNLELKNINFGTIDMVLDYLDNLKINPVFVFDFSDLPIDLSRIILNIFLEHLFINYERKSLSRYGICIDYRTSEPKVFAQYTQFLISEIQNHNKHLQLYLCIQAQDLPRYSSYFKIGSVPDYIIVEHPHFALNEMQMNIVNNIMKASAWKNAKVIMSDITFQSDEKCPLNDTLVRCSYLLNTLLKYHNNFDGVHCFALTDFSESTGKNSGLFNGRNGLFTYMNLRKSSYYIFDFLYHFNENILTKGNGYVVCKKEEVIYILLQNPSLYNSFEENTEKIQNLSYTTDTLLSYPYMTFHLSLTGLEFKKYIAHIFKINTENGCSYQYWLESSSLNIGSIWELKDMQDKSAPYIQRKLMLSDYGTMNMSIKLQPFEFRLIKLVGVNEI